MRILLALFYVFMCDVILGQTTSTNDSAVRFQAVDVFVDSGESPLAAYQLDFNVTSDNAKVVGIEGGEHAAFAEAPYYDPKAIQQERVIIAAFSTAAADQLPKGKTRVATIHLQVSGTNTVTFATRLDVAAGTDGASLEAEVSATEKRAK